MKKQSNINRRDRERENSDEKYMPRNIHDTRISKARFVNFIKNFELGIMDSEIAEIFLNQTKKLQENMFDKSFYDSFNQTGLSKL